MQPVIARKSGSVQTLQRSGPGCGTAKTQSPEAI